MAGKKEKDPQLSMPRMPLKQFIDEGHGLVHLSKKIGWEELGNSLSGYYCGAAYGK